VQSAIEQDAGDLRTSTSEDQCCLRWQTSFNNDPALTVKATGITKFVYLDQITDSH